ncbi:hypothetical protein U27_02712 [Candidatus Vecturithrix granuli]|uniref:Uncharacterized protein n=1 Tax=Vecturithrix granuli TaxID=1499967 RepID=A0A081BTU8_VECG1|nr:hypothetical protein U27_02712 [Candidatus Vecturithrix granuli]
MKSVLLRTTISLLLGFGITFLVFPQQKNVLDPVRAEYAETFLTFDKHAEELYRQYGPAALTFLQTFQIEALRIFSQYGSSVQQLQPYLSLETIFSLFQQHDAQLEQVLTVFHPRIIADVYTRFGNDGLKYLLDEPEIYFLLQQYGERLISLANAKGPIVFTLVKKHEPEFLELYYDDALFQAMARFGVDGLLALKAYRGKASTIFEIFADDDRFASVLRTYSYQQVIPILYYFYQKPQQTNSVIAAIANFEIYRLFEKPEEQERDALNEHIRIDQANWALQRIYESGQTFLRQFVVTEQGDVRPLPLMALTNLVESLISPVNHNLGNRPASQDIQACESLKAALQVFGLLPAGIGISNQAICLALQTGLPHVKTIEGMAGLIQLDEYTDLMNRYGNGVVPFVARYGRPGIDLLEQTDGEILYFSTLYGEEVMQYILRYGSDVFTLIKTYGEQMLTAIRATHGAIMPYMSNYSKEVFIVLAQPHGASLFSLCPVFGEDLLVYAARYLADFSRCLLKYGALTMNAFRRYDQRAADLARQYGDEAIYYLGLHGDPALQLLNAGKIGLAFLEVLPEDFFLTEGEKAPSTVWETTLTLLRRHPSRFHHLIGVLGNNLLSLPRAYSQLIFWTLMSFIALLILKSGYTLLRQFFVIEE